MLIDKKNINTFIYVCVNGFRSSIKYIDIFCSIYYCF